ncbi:hypothetical protein GMRT_10060 [Giardia muris]|uniref:Uncharacterized protein n=1 Tax=Giardia muris TaxID=5742 RepID=A0A4Z1SMX7_GIAMU|nr:hypothetical protein GMRT_10060 [Giardia muris]|eukprot:TNJ27082.1 hypothetical protein GMRT_10060 [Giardia muris]
MDEDDVKALLSLIGEKDSGIPGLSPSVCVGLQEVQLEQLFSLTRALMAICPSSLGEIRGALITLSSMDRNQEPQSQSQPQIALERPYLEEVMKYLTVLFELPSMPLALLLGRLTCGYLSSVPRNPPLIFLNLIILLDLLLESEGEPFPSTVIELSGSLLTSLIQSTPYSTLEALIVTIRTILLHCDATVQALIIVTPPKRLKKLLQLSQRAYDLVRRSLSDSQACEQFISQRLKTLSGRFMKLFERPLLGHERPLPPPDVHRYNKRGGRRFRKYRKPVLIAPIERLEYNDQIIDNLA